MLRTIYCFFLINFLRFKYKSSQIFYPLNIAYTWDRNSYIYVHDLVYEYYLEKNIFLLKYFFLKIYYLVQFSGKQNIAVPSEFIKKRIESSFNKKNVKVIREGFVFEGECMPIEKNKNFVFLINSYKANHKNIEDLFSVFKNLINLKNPVEFRFTGRKSQKIKTISESLTNVNLKITQTGYLPKDLMLQEICNSNCLIYCTEYEGFGLPVIEAFQLNKNIICSNIEVLREFNYSGQYFYENGDLNSLKDKILEQLDKTEEKKKILLNETNYSWREIVNWIIN